MTVREPSVSEVKSELQDLLNSREFRQSKSLSKLLRYICSTALIGESEPITEYTIAVDVLGKPKEFKESKDASVRVEVHRLRKRLAEFYANEGASHRVRIAIPTGHYFPQFLIHEAEPPVEAPPKTVPAEVISSPPPSSRPDKRRWNRAARIGLWVLAATILLLAARFITRPEEPIDSLWQPVLSSSNPILLCIGNLAGGRHSTEPTAANEARISVLDFHGMKSEIVHVDDATTLTRFAGLLQSKGKPYRVVSQSEATFADLQSGPAVLIGLSNNDWTERLVGKLRFWLEHAPPGKLILRDREHPERADWSMDYSSPYLDITRDYAVVMRVLDPKTEQTVISAAGISVFGTTAAGDFLTSAQEFRKIQSVAPKGWQKMNFELVLATDVIRGKSGHASIVASHFW